MPDEDGKPQHKARELGPQKKQREPIKVQLITHRRWQEDAVAYCATIVAISALVISIWQVQLSVKHNRLSVRPLLRASTYFGAAYEAPGLILKNRGIGPAIVSDAHLYLDGALQGAMQDKEWDELLMKAELGNSIFVANYSFEAGSVIQPGEIYELFVIPKGWPRTEEERFEDLVKRRLGVEICYCSLYEDCWRLVMTQNESSTDQEKCGLKNLKRGGRA